MSKAVLGKRAVSIVSFTKGRDATDNVEQRFRRKLV